MLLQRYWDPPGLGGGLGSNQKAPFSREAQRRVQPAGGSPAKADPRVMRQSVRLAVGWLRGRWSPEEGSSEEGEGSEDEDEEVEVVEAAPPQRQQKQRQRPGARRSAAPAAKRACADGKSSGKPQGPAGAARNRAGQAKQGSGGKAQAAGGGRQQHPAPPAPPADLLGLLQGAMGDPAAAAAGLAPELAAAVAMALPLAPDKVRLGRRPAGIGKAAGWGGVLAAGLECHW